MLIFNKSLTNSIYNFIVILNILYLFTACSKTQKKAPPKTLIQESKQETKDPDDQIYWYDSINMDQDSIWGITPEPKPKIVPVNFEKYGFKLKPGNQDYHIVKEEIKTHKKRLKVLLDSNNVTKDSIYRYFNEALINKIIPYWYGTEWTFEGHTDTPKKGSIACGYFVSTTLKHMGTNLDRFLLAKQSALNEAKSLSAKEPIIPFYNKTPKKVIDHIKKHLTEGVYMVGLDFHVGYLVYRKQEVFFVHSSYFEPPQVVIELAIQSPAFNNSKHFFVSKISHNEDFINKWLNNEALKIVLDK